MISIIGLDKAAVLATLYNASRPLGMGFLHYDPSPMTVAEAQQILDGASKDKYFDYLKGRVMKIAIDGNELDARLYDRDNGENAAQRAIETLLTSGPAGIEIQAAHDVGKAVSAESARTGMRKPSGFVAPGVYHMGLSDVASELETAIHRAGIPPDTEPDKTP